MLVYEKWRDNYGEAKDALSVASRWKSSDCDVAVSSQADTEKIYILFLSSIASLDRTYPNANRPIFQREHMYFVPRPGLSRPQSVDKFPFLERVCRSITPLSEQGREKTAKRLEASCGILKDCGL